MKAAKGRSVAIVGRAWYLAESGLGGEIDSAGFVVRINWSLPIEPKLHEHVGKRTDLLYTMQISSAVKLHQKAITCKVKYQRLNHRLRVQLAERMGNVQRYIPNTGTVAIFDALEMGATEVRAYGFDLHTSNKYVDTGKEHNNRETYAKHRSYPAMRTHNPDLDRELLRGLLTDPRFKPDATLRAVLA